MAALLDILPVDRDAETEALALWVDWWQSSYLIAVQLD